MELPNHLETQPFSNYHFDFLGSWSVFNLECCYRINFEVEAKIEHILGQKNEINNPLFLAQY